MKTEELNKIDATGTFKISPKWDNNCGIPFDNLLSDAAFAFVVDKNHVRIVTRNNYNGINCFAIGYDRWGLIEYGESKFNSSWGDQIKDSSANIIKFIKDYLTQDGAGELMVK